jgi:hypothetical protein
MSAQHSSLVRGLFAAGKNPNLEGARFGRLFPSLPAATFGKTAAEEERNLGKLAKAMVSSFDMPKDGPDEEESGIPALYTYFGQFVDHDLTFDPDASFQKQNDPAARVDFRTVAFDLDNLYGRGPGDQPYMYADDGKSFLLGDPLNFGSTGARDLQRNAAGRALIGDPRNDENAIVSQFQGLMLRFHNAMVRKHPKATFERVQELVRHHYQYVVVHDFLARIVNARVLSLFNQGRLRPVEIEVLHEFRSAFRYSVHARGIFGGCISSGPFHGAPGLPIERCDAAADIPAAGLGESRLPGRVDGISANDFGLGHRLGALH